VAEKDDYLVDMLADLGFVTSEQIDQAKAEAQSSGVGIVDYMVANKMVRPADVTQAKAAHFGAEVVQLAGLAIADDVIASVPRHIAKKYRVVPVFRHDSSLTVAIADPSDLATIDSLTHLLHSDITIQVASEADIEGALSKYYGGGMGGAENEHLKNTIQQLTEEHVEVADVNAGPAVDADAPLIRLVNQIIIDAFKMRASDIHLEPLAKRFRLRYRIDGMLHEIKGAPETVAAFDHCASQDPVEHVHRGTSRPAGRTYSDECGRQGHRLARVVPADESR
jgi:general secretion pathway protein E/type IV pilus assembly protein PilB